MTGFRGVELIVSNLDMLGLFGPSAIYSCSISCTDVNDQESPLLPSNRSDSQTLLLAQTKMLPGPSSFPIQVMKNFF